jgi:hypothetical protein
MNLKVLVVGHRLRSDFGEGNYGGSSEDKVLNNTEFVAELKDTEPTELNRGQDEKGEHWVKQMVEEVVLDWPERPLAAVPALLGLPLGGDKAGHYAVAAVPRSMMVVASQRLRSTLDNTS